LEIRHAKRAGFIHREPGFSDGDSDRFASKRSRLDGHLQWDHHTPNEQRDGHNKCELERPAKLLGLVWNLLTCIRHGEISSGAYQRNSGFKYSWLAGTGAAIGDATHADRFVFDGSDELRARTTWLRTAPRGELPANPADFAFKHAQCRKRRAYE
jgi:hypothetical protein